MTELNLETNRSYLHIQGLGFVLILRKGTEGFQKQPWYELCLKTTALAAGAWTGGGQVEGQGVATRDKNKWVLTNQFQNLEPIRYADGFSK